MIADLRRFILPPTCSLREGLSVIDAGAEAICCLVDDEGRLVATLTDGDVRRALLAGAGLDSAALKFASRRPRTVDQSTPRALVLDLMKSMKLRAVPELDRAGCLVGLHTMSEMFGAEPLTNSAVIMAGGKGTRLGTLTSKVPKPLMTVAGRSILEWLILGLVGGGIRTIYISINYLGDQIVDVIGDGSVYGCRVIYLREDPDRPLGTGGSLSMIDPLPAEPLIVMNGDLMVEFDPVRLIEHHVADGASVTVGVRTYAHTVPYGVVEIGEDGRILAMSEKPELHVDINAAVYCIDPEVIAFLETGQPASMPDLIQSCLDAQLPVSAWSITSDWIDIGTPAELMRAKGNP